jgi:hypothetical protein
MSSLNFSIFAPPSLLPFLYRNLKDDKTDKEPELLFHGEWLEMLDIAANTPYYVNQLSGESAWELPATE